jgi:hypothetical protein
MEERTKFLNANSKMLLAILLQPNCSTHKIAATQEILHLFSYS